MKLLVGLILNAMVKFEGIKSLFFNPDRGVAHNSKCTISPQIQRMLRNEKEKMLAERAAEQDKKKQKEEKKRQVHCTVKPPNTAGHGFRGENAGMAPLRIT